MRSEMPNHTISDCNRAIDQRRYLGMSLKKYKLVKSTIISILIVGFGVWAIGQGADVSMTSYFVLAGLLLINGIEFSEFFAVWAEIQAAADDTGDDDA